jgi:hypothetical protein
MCRYVSATDAVLGAPAAMLCKGIDGQHQCHRKKTNTSFHVARMSALHFPPIAPGAAKITAEIILHGSGSGTGLRSMSAR